MSNIKVIITAGGTSSRFGKNNKLLEKLAGKEVIKYSVEKFLSFDEISEIIIPANKSVLDVFSEFFKSEKKVTVIEGGENRQASVYKGIIAADGCGYILVHDAARPLISLEVIKKCIDEVKVKKALSVMTKTTDTIKVVDDNGKIQKTLDRTFLYNTQTPQAFEYSLLKNAHEKYLGEVFTDDAGLVEAYGQDVYTVENDYRNIKITSKTDMDIAEAYLRNM